MELVISRFVDAEARAELRKFAPGLPGSGFESRIQGSLVPPEVLCSLVNTHHLFCMIDWEKQEITVMPVIPLFRPQAI